MSTLAWITYGLIITAAVVVAVVAIAEAILEHRADEEDWDE